MKIFRQIILILLLFPSRSFSQSDSHPYTLTDSSSISLITASPGTELWARWGHSAIRVKDPVKPFDLVFNYGTFDFNTPGFYIKFLRGKLKVP